MNFIIYIRITFSSSLTSNLKVCIVAPLLVLCLCLRLPSNSSSRLNLANLFPSILLHESSQRQGLFVIVFFLHLYVSKQTGQELVVVVVVAVVTAVASSSSRSPALLE